MELFSPVTVVIAYFIVVIALGVSVCLFMVWLARISTGFFKD